MFKCISPDIVPVSVSGNTWKIVEGEMHNVGQKQSLNVEKKRKQTGKPRIVNPEEFETVDDLFAEVRYWWKKRYRKGEDSWNSYENKLRAMMNHDIYPVDPFNLNPDQVVAHLDYVEDGIEATQGDEHNKTGIYRVINRWKAVKALMRSYGRIEEVDNWNYTPPSDPKPKPKKIPSIATVHKLIHHKYSTDRYESKLYQYLALFSFMIGFRTASEMSILKVSDWDAGTRELTFYQPKVEAWRTVVLPNRMVDSKNTKNITSWIESWRPKVVTSESEDFFFIQPNGRPFTKAYLTKKLRENFRPIWDKYYPYSSRHWYATASLIKTRVEHGTYGMTEVCDDMHHSSESVTKGYTRTANRWWKKAPYDWFAALLKFTKNGTVKECKTSTIEKIGGTGNFSPGKRYESAGVKTCFLLLDLPALEQKMGVLGIFSTFLSQSFFSFFYVFFILEVEGLSFFLESDSIFFPSTSHHHISSLMGIGGSTGYGKFSQTSPSISPGITEQMQGIHPGSSPELSIVGREVFFQENESSLIFHQPLSKDTFWRFPSHHFTLEIRGSTDFLAGRMLVHSPLISFTFKVEQMQGIHPGSSPELSISERGVHSIKNTSCFVCFYIVSFFPFTGFIMGAGSLTGIESGSLKVHPIPLHSIFFFASSSLPSLRFNFFLGGVVFPALSVVLRQLHLSHLSSSQPPQSSSQRSSQPPGGLVNT